MRRAMMGMAMGAVLAGGLAGGAAAHRMWLLPSTFTLSGDEQWITVDGAISNDLFFPNHVPFPLSDITVVAPDGSASPAPEGWEGQFRSVFDLKLDRQGTWKIVGGGGTFFARWMEDGAEQAVRGSLEDFRDQGVMDKDGVAFMFSGRRIESYVTLGAPTEAALAPTGQGLELVPVTHPNDIYAGETAQFRLLLDGEPLAGAEITAIAGQDRYRDGVDAIAAVTDETGAFEIALPHAGRYWLNAELDGAATTIEGIEMQALMTYALTLEALPL